MDDQKPAARWSYSEAGPGVTLSVIVPVFNERHLAPILLDKLATLEFEGVAKIEVVTVDDASTDGSREILDMYAQRRPDRFHVLARRHNGGKGAALRTGIRAATGDLIVFQDADLEYEPREYLRLLEPILDGRSDVVYGSRFLGSEHQDRASSPLLSYLANRLITLTSNAFTGLELTDVETCYKMMPAHCLKSMPLCSDDFAIEIEITARIAALQYRVTEVPISYRPRSRKQGKKISWRDGLKALWAIVRFWLAEQNPRWRSGRRHLPSDPEVCTHDIEEN